MFTLYWIAFAPARKPFRIALLFTHKNGDFGAISVKAQIAGPRRSLKWRVTYRGISVHTRADKRKSVWFNVDIAS